MERQHAKLAQQVMDTVDKLVVTCKTLDKVPGQGTIKTVNLTSGILEIKKHPQKGYIMVFRKKQGFTDRIVHMNNYDNNRILPFNEKDMITRVDYKEDETARAILYDKDKIYTVAYEDECPQHLGIEDIRSGKTEVVNLFKKDRATGKYYSILDKKDNMPGFIERFRRKITGNDKTKSMN